MCEVCEERKCSRHCSCKYINNCNYEKYPCNHNSIYDARCMYRHPYQNKSYYGNYYGPGYRDTYLMDLLNSDRGSVKQV